MISSLTSLTFTHSGLIIAERGDVTRFGDVIGINTAAKEAERMDYTENERRDGREREGEYLPPSIISH